MKRRFTSPLCISAILASLLGLALPVSDAAAQQAKAPRAKQGRRMTGEQMEWAVFDLVNAERKKAGLSVLKWDPDLLIIARQHSEKMSRLKSITHYEGERGLGERLSDGGIRGWTVVGENLGQNRGYVNPAKAIFDKWLVSKEHKKNLLDPRWDVTAVGVSIDRLGQVYFTQDFVSFRR